MNVTELARKLKITTNELKEFLPRLGYDIGKKAIKVDDKSAQKIMEMIKSSPDIIARLRGELTLVDQKDEIIEKQTGQELVVPQVITVRDFAALVNKPVVVIIQELMKNGILANLNEQIDYETASIIAQDLGYKTSPQKEEKQTLKEEKKIEEILSEDKNQQPRPPVVIVMGHVDHGKTQLLDTIRKTKVMAQESGGITQHIGAYQVMARPKEEPSSRPRASEGGIPPETRDDRANRTITFIDTPGHEAFTAMRSRGARVADIAIVVIAADDGIKPQTEEVLKIIENAKLPFIVALNKIDKPEADVQKVKQQLAQKNLLPEDWGGKTVCLEVSAKTGQGIDALLEHLLLVAEMEKDNIKANPDREAIGTIIESHIDKGEGPVATVLIQTGTLHQGDIVQIGEVAGKIRAMKDYKGQQISAAPPSTPVRILGLKAVPEVGDFLRVTDQKSLKSIMKNIKQQQTLYRHQQNSQSAKTKDGGEKNKKKSLNIIVKTDMVGSQEALLQSLETLSNEEIKVTVIKKGLGNIMDMDVLQAESSAAIIYGFNVKINQRAKEISSEKNVPVRTYNVIYDLINDVKKEVDKLISFKIEVVELGRAKIIAIFRTEKSSVIIGTLVTKGKIEKDAKTNIIRQDKKIGMGVIKELQQAKQAVAAVASGTECGVQLNTTTPLQIDDFLEVYKEELKK